MADAIRALSSRIDALERGAAEGDVESPAEVRRLYPRRGPNPAGG